MPRIANPLWRLIAAPIGRVQHFTTIGTTPESARRILGLEWTTHDEVALRILGRMIAHAVPLLPERLRYFPIAYEARRLGRDRERLRKVLDLRPL